MAAKFNKPESTFDAPSTPAREMSIAPSGVNGSTALVPLAGPGMSATPAAANPQILRAGKRKREPEPPTEDATGTVITAASGRDIFDIAAIANSVLVAQPMDQAARSMTDVIIVTAMVASQMKTLVGEKRADGKQYDKIGGNLILLSIDCNDAASDAWVLETYRNSNPSRPPLIRAAFPNTFLKTEQGTEKYTCRLPAPYSEHYEVTSDIPNEGVVLVVGEMTNVWCLKTMWPTGAVPGSIVRIVFQHTAKLSKNGPHKLDCYLTSKQVQLVGTRGTIEHLQACLESSVEASRSMFLHPNMWQYKSGQYAQAPGPILFAGARTIGVHPATVRKNRPVSDQVPQYSIYEPADTAVSVKDFGFLDTTMFARNTTFSYGMAKDGGEMSYSAKAPIQMTLLLLVRRASGYFEMYGEWVPAGTLKEVALTIPIFPTRTTTDAVSKESPIPGLSFMDVGKFISNPHANAEWTLSGILYYTINTTKHSVVSEDAEMQARAASAGTAILGSTSSMNATVDWMALNFSPYLIYNHLWATLIGPASPMIAIHRTDVDMRQDAEISARAIQDLRARVPGTACILNKHSAKYLGRPEYAFVPCQTEEEAKIRDDKMAEFTKRSGGVPVVQHAFVAVSMKGTPHTHSDYERFAKTNPNGSDVMDAMERFQDVVVFIVMLYPDVTAHMLAQRQYPWFPTHTQVPPYLHGRKIIPEVTDDALQLSDDDWKVVEEVEANAAKEKQAAHNGTNAVNETIDVKKEVVGNAEPVVAAAPGEAVVAPITEEIVPTAISDEPKEPAAKKPRKGGKGHAADA